MNSQKKLTDIYIQNVTKTTNTTSSYKNLSNIYECLYVEDKQQELEGIAPGAGSDEDRVAVFHIPSNNLTDEIVAQFREIGGDGPINIPLSYFTKVERRFRGKTIESLAHEWLSLSTKGKMDNLTYESLLNKLFDSDIRGAEDLKELKQFIGWKKGEEDIQIQDAMKETLASDVSTDVDFSSLLTPVIEFFMASDPDTFLRSLWNVTEQSKQVSIGKGEIAIALLSRGFKGEPGDVKYKLTDDDEELKVEVKGRGGRPGASLYTHGLSSSLQKMFKKRNKKLGSAEVDDLQSMIYNGSTLTKKWENVREWFNTTLRNKPVVKEHSGTDQGDVITNFISNMSKIVNTQSNRDVKAVVKQIDTELKKLESWLESIAPGQSLIPKHIYEVLTKPSSAGLAFFIASRNQLKDVESITELESWQMVVRSFFNWFANVASLSEDEISRALVEVRSDPIPKLAGDLQNAIYTLLMSQGKEIVFDRETLGKLVAAIQFTGYCSSDGFNRVLFVNDNTLQGRVVPTYPDDVSTTLNNLYSEFINSNYHIDMGIDSRNKGVQVVYEG